MCPADQSKYVGVGTVILFTAFMAWFSSFIAMRLVLGVAEEDVGLLLVMLTLDQAIVLENIPGFEADPMIVCGDCYEVVEE